jgi:hypothetical protein
VTSHFQIWCERCQLCIGCSLAASEIRELVVGIAPKHHYGSDTKWIISKYLLIVLFEKKNLLIVVAKMHTG